MMEKILIYSETIFSDRLCRAILSQTQRGSVNVVFSDQVVKNDLFLLRSDAPVIYKVRVRISRYIFVLLKYVAPRTANAQALEDHFILDFLSSGWCRRKFSRLLVFLLSNFKYFRKIVQKIALYLIPTDAVAPYLNTKERVSVLFFSFANLKSISVMSLFSKLQQKNNITSFSIVQSWDNPTTKGYGVIRPNYTFTWTDLMREEIAMYQDISLNRSSAIGSPTFIRQHAAGKTQDILKKKQTLIFATKSPASYKNNIDIAIFLALYCENKNLDLEVRLHPLCLLRKSDEFARLKFLSERHKFNLRYADTKNDMPNLNSEEDNLACSSNPGDILVTVYSTMNLEAAYVGLKCINIDFELTSSVSRSPRMNMDIDRRQLHNQRLLSYGYIYNVNSFEELSSTLDKIRIGQVNSEDLTRSRELLVENECQPVFTIGKLLESIEKYSGTTF